MAIISPSTIIPKKSSGISIGRCPIRRPATHDPISMPMPHVEISAAKPTAPTPNSLASGASATIAQPTMLYATTSAATTTSRMRVRKTSRIPSVNGTLAAASRTRS